MTRLTEKEFIVVAGKGGCGRTTVSLVIGRCLAARSRRTLVCLANAPPRYLELLGQMRLSPTIQNVGPHLDMVNLDPRASREEYGRRVLKSRTLHRLVFSSKVVRSFLDAVPGLAEWAMLGKATYHALGQNGGVREYDTVVFDSPATGHGLDILALPRAIVSAVPTGRMREEAMLRCELMEDRTRSEVIPVTLPEEMPVNETLEFAASLARLGMSVERVVVNRVLSRQLSPSLEQCVDESAGVIEREPWLLPSAVRLSRKRSEERNLRRLQEQLKVPQIKLPDLSTAKLPTEFLSVLEEKFRATNDNR